jgi:hypothetical protein
VKDEAAAARKRMEQLLDKLAIENPEEVHELRNQLQILHYLKQEAIILEKIRGGKESEVA